MSNLPAPNSSIIRSDYDFHKMFFYNAVPYEKAVGKINPYNGEVVRTREDYDLYCHCFIVKSLSENLINQSKLELSDTKSKLATSNKTISNLRIKNSELEQKNKTFRFLFSLFLFLSCLLFLCLLSRPSSSEYKRVLSEYESQSAVISEYESSSKEWYNDGYEAGHEIGYDIGFDAGYSAGHEDALKTERPSSSSGSSNSSYYNKTPSTGTSYIGNASTKVFHRSDCSYLPSVENQVALSTRSSAINSGYSPCGHCNP